MVTDGCVEKNRLKEKFNNMIQMLDGMMPDARDPGIKILQNVLQNNATAILDINSVKTMTTKYITFNSHIANIESSYINILSAIPPEQEELVKAMYETAKEFKPHNGKTLNRRFDVMSVAIEKAPDVVTIEDLHYTAAGAISDSRFSDHPAHEHEGANRFLSTVATVKPELLKDVLCYISHVAQEKGTDRGVWARETEEKINRAITLGKIKEMAETFPVSEPTVTDWRLEHPHDLIRP